MSEIETVQYQELSITERMRNAFQPLGTAPLSYLPIGNQFFHVEFINKCIDELERMPAKAFLGEQPSNLEKLAYELLCAAAYIETGRPQL